MKIPTIFFINKIDQEGIDLPMVYREMKAKPVSYTHLDVYKRQEQTSKVSISDEEYDAVLRPIPQRTSYDPAAPVYAVGDTAVSYTHLDVYKRQHCGFGGRWTVCQLQAGI